MNGEREKRYSFHYCMVTCISSLDILHEDRFEKICADNIKDRRDLKHVRQHFLFQILVSIINLGVSSRQSCILHYTCTDL